MVIRVDAISSTSTNGLKKTRTSRVAGENSTTEPLIPAYQFVQQSRRKLRKSNSLDRESISGWLPYQLSKENNNFLLVFCEYF